MSQILTGGRSVAKLAFAFYWVAFKFKWTKPWIATQLSSSFSKNNLE